MTRRLVQADRPKLVLVPPCERLSHIKVRLDDDRYPHVKLVTFKDFMQSHEKKDLAKAFSRDTGPRQDIARTG